VRCAPSGAPVAELNLAIGELLNDRSGEQHKCTERHNIVAWNHLAEICGPAFDQGRADLRARKHSKSLVGRSGRNEANGVWVGCERDQNNRGETGVKRQQAKAFAIQLASKGLSRNSVRRAVGLLSEVLNAALDEGKIDRNPATRILRPHRRGEQTEDGFEISNLHLSLQRNSLAFLMRRDLNRLSCMLSTWSRSGPD
jgi:hypothetical protein